MEACKLCKMRRDSKLFFTVDILSEFRPRSVILSISLISSLFEVLRTKLFVVDLVLWEGVWVVDLLWDSFFLEFIEASKIKKLITAI